MNDLFKKLQLKDMNAKKLILNAPDQYLKQLVDNHISFDTEVEENNYSFIQIFGTSNEEIKELGLKHIQYLIEDGLLWLCYPKKSSKKYRNLDCNRDTVARLLESEHYGPVRQISIDEDFSALRFRNENFINRINK